LCSHCVPNLCPTGSPSKDCSHLKRERCSRSCVNSIQDVLSGNRKLTQISDRKPGVCNMLISIHSSLDSKCKHSAILTSDLDYSLSLQSHSLQLSLTFRHFFAICSSSLCDSSFEYNVDLLGSIWLFYLTCICETVFHFCSDSVQV